MLNISFKRQAPRWIAAMNLGTQSVQVGTFVKFARTSFDGDTIIKSGKVVELTVAATGAVFPRIELSDGYRMHVEYNEVTHVWSA